MTKIQIKEFNRDSQKHLNVLSPHNRIFFFYTTQESKNISAEYEWLTSDSKKIQPESLTLWIG